MEKSIMKSVAERGCISWETTPLKMYILLVILTDYPDDFLCPQTRSTLQQSDGNTLTPAYHLLAIEASSPEEEKGKKELAAPPAKEEKPAAPPSSRLPVFPNGNRIAALLGRPKSTSATAAPALPAPGTGRPSTRSTLRSIRSTSSTALLGMMRNSYGNANEEIPPVETFVPRGSKRELNDTGNNPDDTDEKELD